MSDIQSVREWIVDHNRDYGQVRGRLDACRNVILHGRLDAASEMLRASYINAVLSIRTDKDRHESAFAAYYASDKVSLKDAALQTVYGGHKKNWLDRTHNKVDWEMLAIAVRQHIKNGRIKKLLETVVDNIVGVSYRKGSFMLAMVGMHEYMCIDSNVGNFADIDSDKEYYNATSYLSDCKDIYDEINTQWLPPFIVQWAIYDVERGEHARHMPFYNQVLGGK
jgi:hypothetical protein